MTEVEWESGINPDPMLWFVRDKVSDRKLRLFAVACFRRLVALLPDPRQREGINVLEQLADGAIPLDASRDVLAGLRNAIPPDDRSPDSPPADDLHFAALMLYREFRSSSIAVHAILAPAALADGTREQHDQAHLARCIFGNPFRSVRVEPSWTTSAVVSLAELIYESRTFDRLPNLADALEDAGCYNAELLVHCRNDGPHARGCWLIDLLLGRV